MNDTKLKAWSLYLIMPSELHAWLSVNLLKDIFDNLFEWAVHLMWYAFVFYGNIYVEYPSVHVNVILYIVYCMIYY